MFNEQHDIPQGNTRYDEIAKELFDIYNSFVKAGFNADQAILLARAHLENTQRIAVEVLSKDPLSQMFGMM